MIILGDRWIGKGNECWVCQRADKITFITTAIHAADLRKSMSSAAAGRRGKTTMLIAYVNLCSDCFTRMNEIGLNAMGYVPPLADGTIEDVLRQYPLRRTCWVCAGEKKGKDCVCGPDGTIAHHGFDLAGDHRQSVRSGSEDTILRFGMVPGPLYPVDTPRAVQEPQQTDSAAPAPAQEEKPSTGRRAMQGCASAPAPESAPALVPPVKVQPLRSAPAPSPESQPLIGRRALMGGRVPPKRAGG